MEPGGPVLSELRDGIAVVVLNWNGGDVTLECLRALEAVRGEWEICLLVDNGSSDGSADRALAAYPWVQCLRTGRNLGYAGGNNVGLRRARELGAAAILLLNNDAFVSPGAIRDLSSVLRAEPSAALVGPVVRSRQGRVQSAGGTVGFDPFRVRERRDIPEGALRVDYVPGSALLARSKAIDRVGFLDERFFLCWEDTDWAFRMRKAGYEAVVTPTAAVTHVGSASFGGNETPLYLYYFFRNMLLFLELHAPPGRLRPCRRNVLGLARENLDAARRRGRGGRVGLALLAAAGHYARRRFGSAPRWLVAMSARWP